MRTNDCKLKLCAGLFLTAFAFGSCFAQSATNTPTFGSVTTTAVKVERSLAATVGELLHRDAADALNPPVAKDAVVAPVVALVKPVIKVPDPYLSAIFGMEGARSVRLKLHDKPILTYVENSRDRDTREPNWRLLAVEGRCAYFENLNPPSKKQKHAKSIQEKVCYQNPREIQQSPAVDLPSNSSGLSSVPLSQPLPSSTRP